MKSLLKRVGIFFEAKLSRIEPGAESVIMGDNFL
jgi:hypothetical protein